MSDALIAVCRASLSDPEFRRAQPVEGAQNVVFVGEARVWRFPRNARDCERLDELAGRMRTARRLGLGAPSVLNMVPGPPGLAHLQLPRVAGTSLLRSIASQRPVGAAVADALLGLRGIPPADWPYAQTDWTVLWLGLAASARRHRGLLPPEQADEMISGADRAAVAARDAPVCLVHGDLASDNIMVGEAGDLSGVLDWDEAVVGDPAIDTAAVLHVLPERERHILRSAHRWVDRDLARWEAYRDTWALQDLLWQEGLRPPRWDGTEH